MFVVQSPSFDRDGWCLNLKSDGAGVMGASTHPTVFGSRLSELWSHSPGLSWRRTRTLSSLCILLLLSVFVGCGPSEVQLGSYPRKPVKVVVPFGAGGGSDTFTRIIQKAVAGTDLISEPLVVINVPGAGGSIGSRKVKNARPDGYTILQIHEGMLTNKYSGNSNFGPEAFSPIIGTGQMSHVIAVSKDSPFQTLTDLLQAASDEPDTHTFAVGIGALGRSIVAENSVTLDSWSLWNLTTGISDDQWTAEVFVENLADERAEISGNAIFNRSRVTVARPRTLGLRFAYTF